MRCSCGELQADQPNVVRASWFKPSTTNDCEREAQGYTVYYIDMLSRRNDTIIAAESVYLEIPHGDDLNAFEDGTNARLSADARCSCGFRLSKSAFNHHVHWREACMDSSAESLWW